MSVMLVTGGSRGIGAATALLAAQRGYSVAVNYRSNERAAGVVVDEIISAGGKAVAIAADVSVEGDVLKLFEQTVTELGALSVLVNNAGILEQQSRLQDMSVERFNRVLQTNVVGALLCAREAVKRMSVGNGGAGGNIVNVSSIAATLGSPNEYIDYAATKGAVDSLTVGLAAEVAADGIRVNAVRPGVIHTEIHASGGEPGRVDRVSGSVPMRRGGTAEEVARAILWLASEEASYITGSLLNVSGGR